MRAQQLCSRSVNLSCYVDVPCIMQSRGGCVLRYRRCDLPVHHIRQAQGQYGRAMLEHQKVSEIYSNLGDVYRENFARANMKRCHVEADSAVNTDNKEDRGDMPFHA